jgi:hypothetical protein
MIGQRTIEQLVREAVKYDLILIEADRTNYNYKISVECAVHNPRFRDWLRENNLPPENYTFDRFCEYLRSRRVEKETIQKEFESKKEYYQNRVNGDNKPLPLSLPLPHFSRSFSRSEQKELFAGLTSGGFLPKTANFSHFCHVFGGTAIPDNEKPFKPLKWIQTNKKTKGANPNIRALIEMLVLLKIPENEVKAKAIINAVFEIPNGTKIKAKHYTDITDNKGNLKPFKSEYHNELTEIISKSKENQSL